MTRYSSLSRWNGMHFQIDWTHKDYWRTDIEKERGQRSFPASLEWSVLVEVATGRVVATWTKAGGFVFADKWPPLPKDMESSFGKSWDRHEAGYRRLAEDDSPQG